ncbi:MAG: DUF4158 domain-containing protein [Solirubrobacteraceae bacterium]
MAASRVMRREWEPEELIACWTLVDADRRLVANKSGATRLGFAVLLKFFELEGRFPRHLGEVPPAAVGYVAEQVRVDPDEFATGYALSGPRSSITARRSERRWDSGRPDG